MQIFHKSFFFLIDFRFTTDSISIELLPSHSVSLFDAGHSKKTKDVYTKIQKKYGKNIFCHQQ